MGKEKRVPETIEIRTCLEADIDRVTRFYDRVILWLDAHVNYPRWIIGSYPGERSVRFWIETKSQYICEKGESILGAFALDTDPLGNYQNAQWSRELADGSYMVLHALAIDPQMQGQGVGSEIVRYCLEKAKSEGYEAIRVDVVPTNTPAKRFFENNGFAYAGTVDLEREIEGIPTFSMYECNV